MSRSYRSFLAQVHRWFSRVQTTRPNVSQLKSRLIRRLTFFNCVKYTDRWILSLQSCELFGREGYRQQYTDSSAVPHSHSSTSLVFGFCRCKTNCQFQVQVYIMNDHEIPVSRAVIHRPMSFMRKRGTKNIYKLVHHVQGILVFTTRWKLNSRRKTHSWQRARTVWISVLKLAINFATPLAWPKGQPAARTSFLV